MSKYMFRASLSPEGVAGLLKEGGTARRDVVQKAVETLGGTLEAFYFAFGASDESNQRRNASRRRILC